MFILLLLLSHFSRVWLCVTHRRQPTRLTCPWDSPGKNTGVGCHFLLQCMKVKEKSLSRVQLFATPWTIAYQAPPSMGFSRQEYWSGVPLPSPKHESEKWKWSHSVVSDSWRPHGLQPSRLLHPWDFPGKSTGVGAIAFSIPFPTAGDFPNLKVKPASPASLLHCRQILYCWATRHFLTIIEDYYLKI